MPDLPVAGQRALLVTLITIVLWTTEILEPGVTALLAVTLLPLSGATPNLRAALQGFASPVPYFLVGVLTMGAAVVRSGLAERLARTILERAGGRSLAVYVQLVLAFPVLTFVLPSATTRSGILIHIRDLDDAAGLGDDPPGRAAVVVAGRRVARGTLRGEVPMSTWRIRLTLLLALSLVATDATAQVYRWVDEEGNAHYVGTRDEVPERFRSQLPPDEAREPPKPDPRLTPILPTRPRARVSDECVLRITGRSRRSGAARSYPSCEACRKALEALPRDEAARAACVPMPE